MEISKILIGLLLMSAVIVGLGAGLVTMQNDYNVTTNTTLFSAYDVTGDLAEISGDQQSAVEEGSVDESAFFPFFKIASAFRMVTRTIGMFYNMVYTFFDTVMPGPVAGLFSGIIFTGMAFVIIFALASALWKYKI